MKYLVLAIALFITGCGEISFNKQTETYVYNDNLPKPHLQLDKTLGD